MSPAGKVFGKLGLYYLSVGLFSGIFLTGGGRPVLLLLQDLLLAFPPFLLAYRQFSRKKPLSGQGLREGEDPLFTRLTTYMEARKPYLRSDLLLDDVARAVFTNRLYLSRTIRQKTGLNFRRYVNYYRVRHSAMTYDWKLAEYMEDLALRCGFNSEVSFNASFKLVTGETPSSWFNQGGQPCPLPEVYFETMRLVALSRKLAQPR